MGAEGGAAIRPACLPYEPPPPKRLASTVLVRLVKANKAIMTVRKNRFIKPPLQNCIIGRQGPRHRTPAHLAA
jgi:hypothetical protein